MLARFLVVLIFNACGSILRKQPNGSHEQKTSIGLNVKVHKTGEYALEGQWVGKHSLLWAPPKFLNQDWPNPNEGQKSS